MRRNPDGTRMKIKDRIKQKKEAAEKAIEKAKFEKEYQEKALINKTLRQLQNTCEKYEEQKAIFIKMAKEAQARGLTPQYNMAKTGLKIILDSQEKASSMYLNLAISNQIKQAVGDTKKFILSMSELSKQLSEVNSQIDFVEAEKNYNYAMQEISSMEEKLQSFSENISSSLEDYAAFSTEDTKVDKAIDTLINNSTCSTTQGEMGGINVATPEVVGELDKNKDYIFEKIKSLNNIISEVK